MVTDDLPTIGGIEYYRIVGVEQMEPFLMMVVSDSDLWSFVCLGGGRGGLPPGRPWVLRWT
jgi:hypothetical protein